VTLLGAFRASRPVFPEIKSFESALSPNVISRNGVFPRSILDIASFGEHLDRRTNRFTRTDIPALNSLAVDSLLCLFDEKESLFCRRARLTKNGFCREKVSGKLSAIAMLGLRRLAESGVTCRFDLSSIQDAIWKDRSWIKGIGDLGLLTWFTAACIPERLGAVFDDYDFSRAITAYSDGREARTASLAWFLAGISHAHLAGRSNTPDLTDIAVETYNLIQENQGDEGIFGHAAALPGFFNHGICNRFGRFSDQVYAIYALSTFARAFQIEEPVEPALECANSICALQGEMGQWWFLYDKRTCRVASRYPVLSGQQDGIAPASLLALSEATGQNFRDPIYKGLSWITGTNELGSDLRNLEEAVIWDSIGPKRCTTKWWDRACNLLSISSGTRAANLNIVYEARPDHFGWLLYAFGKFGLPKEAVSVRTAKA